MERQKVKKKRAIRSHLYFFTERESHVPDQNSYKIKPIKSSDATFLVDTHDGIDSQLGILLS